MSTIHKFVVVPAVPEKLAALHELAYNLWSLWNYEAASLFNRLDPDLWEATGHNPVRLLNLIGQDKLRAASEDEGFLAHLNRITSDLKSYMQQSTWFKQRYPDRKPVIAYFSAEFGLHESLPIYSGGLGVLSGDHLKSASDLGIPLVAVGLLYREGYFHQQLNSDGWQQELNPENDFFSMSLTQVKNQDGQQAVITVDYPDSQVRAAVWRVQVGRVTLFLMDCNLEINSPHDRDITARLYGGDHEMRIRQEILLGIGGLRALAAAGITPTVCHMNEGHSAFLALERCRVLMEQEKLTFAEAREMVSASNVFTTHTPVPAGNDAFHRDLIEKYFANYCHKLGISIDELMAMGRVNPHDNNEFFGVTVLALRMAWHANGVSELHGQVSRRMWQRIWPEIPAPEVPIRHITNGVHTQSWLSEGFARLYQEYLGANWTDRPADHSIWGRTDKIPDVEIWRVHERRKERLIHFVRQRLKLQLTRRGQSALDVQRVDEVLDSKSLIIGFARRFATYKRATLLLRNPERLIKLLKDTNQPVQFVFAGKAHPRDDGGKRFIQEIIHFCRREDVRPRMVFLEDYDIDVARYLTQGVDVWLNTPRRPMEASGTSGMKAAINGALNLSILDGWWCEAYAEDNGFAIGAGEDYNNDEYQDEIESRKLFDLLERVVVPLYYDRSLDGLPRNWIKRMKNSIRTICPVYNTNRMVQNYSEMFYLPAHDLYMKLMEGHGAGAAALAQWKQRMVQLWDNVKVRHVESPGAGTVKAGESVKVFATIELGSIPADNVRVELYFGSLDAFGNIQNARVHEMALGTNVEAGVFQYVGAISAGACGQQGYAVRILPNHPNIALRFEPGLVRWG